MVDRNGRARIRVGQREAVPSNAEETPVRHANKRFSAKIISEQTIGSLGTPLDLICCYGVGKRHATKRCLRTACCFRRKTKKIEGERTKRYDSPVETIRYPFCDINNNSTILKQRNKKQSRAQPSQAKTQHGATVQCSAS